MNFLIKNFFFNFLAMCRLFIHELMKCSEEHNYDRNGFKIIFLTHNEALRFLKSWLHSII